MPVNLDIKIGDKVRVEKSTEAWHYLPSSNGRLKQASSEKGEQRFHFHGTVDSINGDYLSLNCENFHCSAHRRHVTGFLNREQSAQETTNQTNN